MGRAPKQLRRRLFTRTIERLVVTQKRKRIQLTISPANKQLARMHRYFACAKRRARRCRIPGGHVTFKVRRPPSLLPATPFSVLHFVKFLKTYRLTVLGATTRRYRQDKLVELQCAAAKALSARAVPTQFRRKLKHRRLRISSTLTPSAVRAAIISRNLLHLLAKRKATSVGHEILTEIFAALLPIYESLKQIDENSAEQF